MNQRCVTQGYRSVLVNIGADHKFIFYGPFADQVILNSAEIDDCKACTAVERVGVDLTNGIAQRYAFKTAAAVKRKIAFFIFIPPVFTLSKNLFLL